MKLCVYGAGGVGGHLAVLLAQSGQAVSVVARGEHLRAIQRDGLSLQGDDGAVVTARLQASDDPRTLGEQDFVLVALKSTALPDLAAGIAPLLGAHTSVVFLQNGIPWWYFQGQGQDQGGDGEGQRLPKLDPDDALRRAIEPRRVLAGITASACTVLGPGRIGVVGGNRPMVLGAPDDRPSEQLDRLERLLLQAGFPVERAGRIRDRIWTKLALNLGSGPLGALAPVSMAKLFAHRACVDARFRIQAEVAAIADAWGCNVRLDFGTQMDFARRSPHVPSIVQDFAAGRRPEVETMFLAPLELARMKGVPTPTLDLLVALACIKAGLEPD